MSLAESQQFFYDLCAHPETMRKLRQDRRKVLKKYFKSAADREALEDYPLERFQTYRNHVSIGLLGGIQSAFPVLRSLVSTKQWNDLLNDFYLKRLSRSPIARRVFQEFSLYLHSYKGPLLKKLPYLHELAEYENLDLRLFFAKDTEPNVTWVTKTPKDPLKLVPILNPQLELRVYRWPVHQISKGHWSPRKLKRGKYPLIVYRHPQSLEIGFMEGNELFGEIIELIRPGQKSIEGVLKQLAKTHGIQEEDRNKFFQEGVETIAHLRHKGIILGMKQSPRRRS